MVVFSLPVVIDEYGEIVGNLFFTSLDGSVRQRRACFVEVMIQTIRQRYLLIIEGPTRLTGPHLLEATRPEVTEAALFGLNINRNSLQLR